ncbi:MAG: hypothetical protein methR_P1218 [Methyloprofundus sp.]|nr:MAG: hypothetical protein methR_P1218 [Methyloprofundus sp.]
MINKTPLINKRYIEEIVLFIVLALSLVGMGITDFSPLESHRYWTLMIIIFAFASIGLGWAKKEYQGKHFQELILRQVTHWGATLMTVSGVYLLLNAGRLNYESTGLIIELILGLSLFLDGRDLGWRFSLLGTLVGITAIVAAYIEEYIWVILLVSLCLSVITYYWEKHRRASLQEEKD